jgi:hypothetical protein
VDTWLAALLASHPSVPGEPHYSWMEHFIFYTEAGAAFSSRSALKKVFLCDKPTKKRKTLVRTGICTRAKDFL